jgi:hypothetical protein
MAKIQDFRRSAITSMISSDVGRRSHMQYAAPETLDCIGENVKLDEKADLYSLGAILYSMLTGQPPFDANEPELLKAAIREQPVPKVSAAVLDCPVWLAAIVEQLLSKDAGARPYSATALQLALKEAQRRQNEGVGVLQHAAAGFSPLQMNVDRDEAEKVLGIKPKKKKRKKKDESFFEQAWVLLVGLVIAIAAVVWFLMPLSESALRSRAEALLESDKWIRWNDARDRYLTQLIERFPDSDNAEWAQEQIEWVDGREAERRMDRDERLGRNDDWTPAQVQYAEARDYERFGDLATARDKYQAIVRLFRKEDSDAPIVFLAGEGLARIRELSAGVGSLSQFLDEKLTEANEAYERARVADAKQILESIIELYSGNQEVAALVARAEQQLEELNN